MSQNTIIVTVSGISRGFQTPVYCLGAQTRCPLKNVELKTLCMAVSVTQVCLNVSECIVGINESNISVAPVCPNEALDMTLTVENTYIENSSHRQQ